MRSLLFKKIFWAVSSIVMISIAVLVWHKIFIPQDQINQMPTSQNTNQENKNLPPQNVTDQTPVVGQPIELSVGQQAKVKNLTITLVAVVDDSRCPVGATCFWAGETVVEIKLSTKEGQEITTYLSTTGAPTMNPEKYTVDKQNYKAREYLFGGYAIQIENVSPERPIERIPEQTGERIAASAYKITFSVLDL